MEVTHPCYRVGAVPPWLQYFFPTVAAEEERYTVTKNWSELQNQANFFFIRVKKKLQHSFSKSETRDFRIDFFPT